MTFFDPACGCGNFLIIAYRELRLLEIEVIRDIRDATAATTQAVLDAAWQSVVRTVRIRPGDNWVRYRFGVYETARMRIRAGDRIRWTANDKRHGLLNGGEAVVLGIDSRRVRFELGGKELSLSRDDRQLRHIDHAWSSTVHAAQGMTRDAAIGVLDTLRRAGRFPGHHRSPSIMTARRRTIPTADRRRGRC